MNPHASRKFGRGRFILCFLLWSNPNDLDPDDRNLLTLTLADTFGWL